MTAVRKNFAMLFALQISTYVVPLVTLPLLTRVLGPQQYGRLSFVLAVTTYFINLVNYSFDLTATPRVALARDKVERSSIFWTTISAQWLITIAGFAVLVAMTSLIPYFEAERTALLLEFGMAIGAALTPGWYFQGIQKLSVFSMTVVGYRALSVAAFFLWVRTPDDILYAVAINAAVPLLCGATLLAYLFFCREIARVRVRFADITEALKGGTQVFLASTSISFYASTNTVLLSIVSGHVAAGYFAAGDKLIRAAVGMLQPLRATTYPHITYLMHNARDEAFAFLRKLIVVQGALVLAMSATIYEFAPLAVRILYGTTFEPTVAVLRCLALVPFMACMTDLFGVQTMLPLGMKRVFSTILISSGLLNVTILPPLASLFAERGAAIAVLMVETTVAVVLMYVLFRERVGLINMPARSR
ncbi:MULTISPECIES: oligosaccharide flippase family protein [Burkholderia]|jgi:PST family polysaccharide transporter|uniref:Oligosaccharide flippase family protein n=1 Tax=Burkholderia cenocepacia TaxID=95486 RepID=A0A144W8A5_9BURK|nr:MULTISPECIES: oligosaccharide flippase family protein [Burkholderia]AIO46033.1 polysaccharide biosynthesis family protein [Burkholderia cepacia]ALV59543.1 polysaccharide biosynthesis protein [Burkholderia cenocepacia]AMU09980.1 polysaccharide biosynthesis protein [Burkholderia cenocepacia]AMU13941.1 polysaccharide biosynthesis protein [Burkholderia cenocepacia]AOK38038.1 polysaccharide biosynthesis protein [Burkholderia cenocepacia]